MSMLGRPSEVSEVPKCYLRGYGRALIIPTRTSGLDTSDPTNRALNLKVQ